MASAFRHRARVLSLLLIRLLLWLPLWLLGLVFLLLGLALSPWGTGWLVSQGEQRGLFSVESVSGAPLDELTLTGLTLQAGPADIRIGRLHLAWADDCLLDGKLCLNALQLEDVDVRIEKTPPASEPAPEPASGGGLPAIAVPFPIELRALELRDVDVQLADGTQLSWRRFTTGARIAGDTLTLLPTRLIETRLRLPATPGQALKLSEITLTAEAIDAAIAVSEPPVAPSTSPSQAGNSEKDGIGEIGGIDESTEPSIPLAERERLELPEIRLPIAVNVPSLVIEDFRLVGPTPYVIERLALSLRGRGHDIHLDSLTLDSPDVDAELEASISLRDDYPLDVSLNAQIHRPPVSGESLALTLDGSLADLSVELNASGPVSARLEAQADVLAPTLPFQVTLNAEQIDWPLADAPGAASEQQTETPQALPQPTATASNAPPTLQSEMAPVPDGGPQPDSYRVRDLTLRAEGDLTGYTAALSAIVTGTAIPEEIRLAMAGEGDLEHFQWRPLSVAAGDGALISRGEVRWTPRLDITTTLHLDRFALEAITDAVSGTLNGDARLHFAMGEQGWTLDVPQLDIDGTLQDRPLALNAKLSGNSDMHWIIDRLRLSQGQNSLTAEGRIAENMTLSGELDAPELSTLLPELGGSLRGNFSLGGTFEAPQLALTLSGEALRYAENSLDSLSLDAKIAGLDDPSLDVALDISGLNAAGQRFTQLALDLDGRLSQHRLTLSADAAQAMPLTQAALVLEGGLNAARDRYQGRLLELEIDSEQAELSLAEPVAFSADLAAGRVTVEPFCLVRRQGGSLCLVETLNASAQRGDLRLALRDVPMDLLAAALPEGWSAEGQTDGEIQLAWSAGGQQWSANANVESRLALSGQDAYGQPWSLPASTLSLNLDATQAQAQLNADLTLAEAGQIQLDLQIDDPAGEAALEGRLRLDDIRLTPYRTLVTGLQQLEGTINGDVALSGDLSNPRLNGRLVLDGLQAQGGDIPLEVRDGRLEIALSGDNATL
ncbi:MAG TPA: translocation/assembly module TamB, partial [Modicisalibacter sp.]|nr:translocation/assembly module TamB [Modicisalibacter sp.]